MPTLRQQVRKAASKRGFTRKGSSGDGDTEHTISTGSTLLDLAISGGRVKGGGIPAGILVEIFGPSGSGKTVMLAEIAGGVQRQGGAIMFRDPEARLDKQFASMFGLETTEMDYSAPDTVSELFSAVRGWEPEPTGKVHGIFADSLAALSTNLEMDSDEGDKMGMRRAKEFSEELRKTCRILKKKNYLMVCSNQVRVNVNSGPYGQRYTSPGGEAVGFYTSLRLRVVGTKKLKRTLTVRGKEVTRVEGIEARVEVHKSSVWRPYGDAPVSIIYDYGVDDIRENLKFLKRFSSSSVYSIGKEKLDRSLSRSISIVEDERLERKLKAEVLRLWHEQEDKFRVERKEKRR